MKRTTLLLGCVWLLLSQPLLAASYNKKASIGGIAQTQRYTAQGGLLSTSYNTTSNVVGHETTASGSDSISDTYRLYMAFDISSLSSDLSITSLKINDFTRSYPSSDAQTLSVYALEQSRFANQSNENKYNLLVSGEYLGKVNFEKYGNRFLFDNNFGGNFSNYIRNARRRGVNNIMLSFSMDSSTVGSNDFNNSPSLSFNYKPLIKVDISYNSDEDWRASWAPVPRANWYTISTREHSHCYRLTNQTSYLRELKEKYLNWEVKIKAWGTNNPNHLCMAGVGTLLGESEFVSYCSLNPNNC